MRAEKRPYVGVSGVEREDEVDSLLRLHGERLPRQPRMLMLGAQVSYRTITGTTQGTGGLPMESVKGVYRRIKDESRGNLLFSLHYYTKPPQGDMTSLVKAVLEKPLSTQVSYLMENRVFSTYKDFASTRPNFQLGLQLNVSWPDHAEVRKIKMMYPGLSIALQMSDFTGMAGRLQGYDSIDYLLIDASRGRGVPFDPSDAATVARSASAMTPAGLVFGGGLSEQNVSDRVLKLRRALNTSSFSIDAEGALRSSGRLDMQKVAGYLRKADEALSENAFYLPA